MHPFNWWWVAMMAAASLVVAVPVAWLAWRESQTILGNVAGTAAIFASAAGFILRERIEIDRIQQACIDAGVLQCTIEPRPFTRFAIYSFVALAEVVALFMWSLRVERHQRNRLYAPEWRR